MRRIISFFTLLAAAGIFLLLSSCKQPIQPIVEPELNFDEPDTIKSSLSFTLNAPLWYSYKWQGKLPSDTLSKQSITSSGAIIKKTILLVDWIGFSHSIDNNVCGLTIIKKSDLTEKDFLAPDEKTIDVLRSWRESRLSFTYHKLPQNIIAPI